MSCIGCDSWAQGDLCDSCSFHSGLVWYADEQLDENRKEIAHIDCEEVKTSNQDNMNDVVCDECGELRWQTKIGLVCLDCDDSDIDDWW